MDQIYKNGTNPDPVTPPPPAPGERSAKAYYQMIKGYRGAAINITKHPPKRRENVQVYHKRLQTKCLLAKRGVTC